MLFDVPNFNTAMLIGTWELELMELVSKLLDNKPSKVFCIGAAEGYYAVGFATKLPKSKIYAFEIQDVYRHFLLNLLTLTIATILKFTVNVQLKS